MHIEDNQIVYSPSDLTLFMSSPFASWMEHLAITNPELLPDADPRDGMINVLQNKGNIHELKVLLSLQKKNLTIINLKENTNAIAETKLAIQSGVDVIYQAALSLEQFKGRADFLVKIKGDSVLGDFHYEIWDTKLAQSVKSSFPIQLCCYAEMLENIQGRRAEFITLVLGNDSDHRLRTNDYFFYYLNLKDNFIKSHQNFKREKCPDPSASSSWGRWSKYAESLLKKDDHLSQVAAIRSSQIKKLHNGKINTMCELANTTIKRIPGMKDSIFENLKAQALIQKKSEGLDTPLYEILPIQELKKQGLALLPPYSPNDLFFDLEGYPLIEGGLEYLWGVTYFHDKGNRQYKDFWGHTSDQEKSCCKEFIEWAYKRWLADPSLHIYHYGNYEITACRKLMGRYGICEYEIDQLLRNHVFVDLYKIIKCSLLLGEPRYSIKNVEHIYRRKRATEVGSGSDSIVAYENWRENQDGETWQTSKLLNDIREYNIDDCNSTQELVDWLRIKQKENNISYLGKTGIEEQEVKEEAGVRNELRDRLLKKAEELDQQGNTNYSSLCLMFAWSLEFHWRESKPTHWRMFDRFGLTEDELLDDFECLAYCSRTNKSPYKPKPKSRNLAYEYSFDPNQEFKGASDSYYVLGIEGSNGKNLTVAYVKEDSCLEEGKIVLQMKEELNEIITLIPNEYVNTDPIPEAIRKQAEAFDKNQLENSAILDFLNRDLPKITGHQKGLPIVNSENPEERLQQVMEAVTNLNNSYLTIQGPPGSGKTYTGKHIIAELLKKGKKIGISSNSNKAINNLLICAAEYCFGKGIEGKFICTKDTEDEKLTKYNVLILDKNDIAENLQPSCVVGTTAWGFARDDLENEFDYLFIDEAGQVSVANLIAMSQATKNIILMGDQMQLGQPSQGCHPGESGLSILDYLLHKTPTIPENMGIFLNMTYRMHSVINQFISDAIYEGKLTSASENDRQRVHIPKGYKGLLNKEAGIIPIPVKHYENTQASDEEVEQIVILTKQLQGRIFTDKEGKERSIELKDIMFVAPYNHQVNKLKAALGKDAKVGSVDKFQGQEAPIVILSMCASNANESPRGLNFLFEKNRINVAISRAQCLALVVYSPALLESSANTLEQLALINLFCMLVNKKHISLH